MSNLLRISEAATLALHAATMLAAYPDQRRSTREIAKILGASQNHLSKVMQRLAKAGLVSSTRGPDGGFELARPAQEISLLQVYEAIEGPLESCSCLLGEPICNGRCILGGLTEEINERVSQYLSETTLDSLTGVYTG